MKTTIRITALSQSLTRTTQASGVAGNRSLLMREPVYFDGHQYMVPMLTGNALRHRALRAPFAHMLIAAAGLDNELSAREINFLFHGGALGMSASDDETSKPDREVASGAVDTELLADLFRLLPALRLIGCCTPSQTVTGAAEVLGGLLVCEENAARIAAMLPAGWSLPGRMKPARAYEGEYDYYRQDRKVSAPDVIPVVTDATLFNMPHGGQCVVAGAWWFTRIIAHRLESEHVGAMLTCLDEWQRKGGTIGGQSSRGHGCLKMFANIERLNGSRFETMSDAQQDACRDDFTTSLVANAPEATTLIHSLFRRQPKVEGQEPKTRKKKQKEILANEQDL